MCRGNWADFPMAPTADKHRRRSDRRRINRAQLLHHLLVAKRTGRDPDDRDTEQQPDVSDAGRQECLDRGGDADGFSYQKPMRRYEHAPTSSHPTNRDVNESPMTRSVIEPVKRHSSA